MWRAGTWSNDLRPTRSMADRQSGLTLIELTVVLLIVSIILGLTFPRIGDLTYSADVKRSLRQLRAILMVARSQAAAERLERRVVCDITEGEIRIERAAAEGGEGVLEPEFESDNSILLRPYKLPKGLSIQDVITETGDKETEGEAYLRIGINGVIAGNMIHLKKDDTQYTLRINPLTGGLSVEEGYQEEYKVAEKNQ